jgi:hypothetical protein
MKKNKTMNSIDGITQLPDCLSCPNVLICPNEVIGISWCANCQRLSWVKSIFVTVSYQESTLYTRPWLVDERYFEQGGRAYKMINEFREYWVNIETGPLSLRLVAACPCFEERTYDAPPIDNGGENLVKDNTRLKPWEVSNAALITQFCTRRGCVHRTFNLLHKATWLYEEIPIEVRHAMLVKAKRAVNSKWKNSDYA